MTHGVGQLPVHIRVTNSEPPHAMHALAPMGGRRYMGQCGNEPLYAGSVRHSSHALHPGMDACLDGSQQIQAWMLSSKVTGTRGSA